MTQDRNPVVARDAVHRRLRTEGLPTQVSEAGDLDFGVLPGLIARQLRIAQLLAFKDFLIEYDGVSLSPGSFEILELLSLNPGLGQTRLASAIGLEKSSLVPAIAKLEEMKLIMRRSSEVDKRAKHLSITAKGSKALAQLRLYVVGRDKQVTRGMSAKEVTLLNQLLTKLAGFNA